MGIKHYWSWFRKRFASSLYPLKKGEQIAAAVDNLMIDMNGIFHTSAQRVYQYGNFKPAGRLLGAQRPPKNTLQRQLEVFKDVCATIDTIVATAPPRKRLVLCVDGPAPLSKQNQQRQRRFMSALERERDKTEEKEVSSFDSNSISPGTKFMDHLTKYVEWYIRKRVTENWAFEVIFSNEKVCGEGEHKCYQFIRKFGVPTETYCIHGMDADLIMLSMGTQLPSFWILREEPNRRDIEFYAISVADARRELVEMMRWRGKDYTYDDRSAINDFIFMCFTVGNDFLPHIPAIEIIQNGIEFMLDVYKNTGSAYGHLTETTTSGLRFRKKALAVFLGTVSQYEKGVLEDKLTQKDKFFPDTLLERYASVKEGKWELDLESYRNAYYREKVGISEEKLEKFSHEYLEGMQWVLSYYSQGVPSWTWKFPYHYAPFSSTITKYVESYSFRDYAPSNPSTPFFQLLSILPPKSASLLPSPLNSLLASPESPLAPYCPETVQVDLSGKRQNWEGVVLLPMIDQALVKGVYNEKVEKVEERERGRDKLGQSFTYRRGSRKYMYKSFYGDFVAITEVKPIQL